MLNRFAPATVNPCRCNSLSGLSMPIAIAAGWTRTRPNRACVLPRRTGSFPAAWAKVRRCPRRQRAGPAGNLEKKHYGSVHHSFSQGEGTLGCDIARRARFVSGRLCGRFHRALTSPEGGKETALDVLDGAGRNPAHWDRKIACGEKSDQKPAPDQLGRAQAAIKKQSKTGFTKSAR